MRTLRPVAGKGGDHYIAPSERSGAKAQVYFTKDLSADGLQRIFNKVSLLYIICNIACYFSCN